MKNQINYDFSKEEIYPDEWEKTDLKCEYCKGKIEKCGFANGPDDYDWKYRCIKCGETYES